MTDSDNRQNDMTARTQPRASTTGEWIRDPDVVARDAECARLRARSMSYQQIAAILGISKTQAFEGVKRALAETLTEPAEELRKVEVEKLDAMERRYLDVIERRHAILHKGGDTGFNDDGPLLQAQAGLLRVAERRARLLGLDQPQQVAVSGAVEYTINGIDPKDLT